MDHNKLNATLVSTGGKRVSCVTNSHYMVDVVCSPETFPSRNQSKMINKA